MKLHYLLQFGSNRMAILNKGTILPHKQLNSCSRKKKIFKLLHVHLFIETHMQSYMFEYQKSTGGT